LSHQGKHFGALPRLFTTVTDPFGVLKGQRSALLASQLVKWMDPVATISLVLLFLALKLVIGSCAS